MRIVLFQFHPINIHKQSLQTPYSIFLLLIISPFQYLIHISSLSLHLPISFLSFNRFIYILYFTSSPLSHKMQRDLHTVYQQSRNHYLKIVDSQRLGYVCKHNRIQWMGSLNSSDEKWIRKSEVKNLTKQERTMNEHSYKCTTLNLIVVAVGGVNVINR